MSKKQLKDLYKAKPELVEEHRRLVNVLRSGSPSEQKKEAAKQLKELKEMLKKEELEKKISLKGALTAGLIGDTATKSDKEDDLEKRCWEGYKPVPGKKPYEKGSCEPVSKEEILKVEKNGQWSFKKKHKSDSDK